MTQELQADVEKFARFIFENYPPSHHWEDLYGYCAWYISKGYIITLVGNEGEIIALCAIRPVERPGLGCLPFYCNDYGDCLHIDLLIDNTTTPLAAMLLARAFEVRFGPRSWVTMFRHHEEKMHVYRYNKFWTSLSRFKRARNNRRKHHGTAVTTTSA